MKILLLEDDVLLNEIIEEFLLERGYEVVSCFDGFEAEDLAYEQKFDIFLFDVNVPDIDGFKLLKKLREQNIKTPAIFITSLGATRDLSNGFESGADDYIKKPFELDELNIRINNIKRLYGIDEDKVLTLGEKIKFDTQNNVLKTNEGDINLTKKESLVLKYLIDNKNRPVSIDELSINIWGYENSPTPATIRTYIKNLRKYLGEDTIENIKGVGYKINIL